MADKSDTLGLRTQVEQYSIHDVEYVGVDTIIYRAEDMRVGREVWLREYFPNTIAKRHLKEGGQSTVYVHPTQSELFAAGKTKLQNLYNSLKGVNNSAIPALYQTFESGGTLYATTQYSGGMKTLRQLYDAKKIFSEQQISAFALSLVRALVILQRTGLQIRSLNPDILLLNTATNECSTAYAEFVPFDEHRVQQLMHELAIVLYGMIDSKNIEDDKPLKPLEPNSVYSAALCGLINRMVFEDASQRPKIFEELQILLQSYRPSEEECEPMVCKKTDNPFSSLASMASIVLILVFAYYVFTQPKTMDIKEVTWLDAARYHLVAYFGNAQAESGLGQMYEKGYGVNQNINEAVHWYKKAAFHGDVEAELSLGNIYLQGLLVKKDIPEAITWFENAYRQGDKRATIYLANIYKNNQDLPMAFENAEKYYGELANNGDINAQKNLAYLKYMDKKQRDIKGAFDLYLKLGQAGETDVQTHLGYMYMVGKGTPIDYVQAMKWFEKSAQRGDSYACGAIGWMYRYGKGVASDRDQAEYWFKKAAEKNDEYSIKSLKSMEKEQIIMENRKKELHRWKLLHLSV